MTIELPCPCPFTCSSNTTSCSRYDSASSIADAGSGCTDCTTNAGLCSTKAFADPALLLRLWNRCLRCLRWRWKRFLLADCCRSLLGDCSYGLLLYSRIDRLLGWLDSRCLNRCLLCWCLDRRLLRRSRDRRLLCADGLRDHTENGSRFYTIVLM
jgi:hypothetical protein